MEAVGRLLSFTSRFMRSRKRNSALLVVVAIALAYYYRHLQRVRKKQKRRQLTHARLLWQTAVEGTKLREEIARSGITPGAWANLSAGRVHYVSLGEGPVVMMVHGFGVFGCVFEGMFDTLIKQGFRVIVPDLYGCGYSESPNVTYNADLFVSQCVELLNNLEVREPVHLVGHSMGGLISAVLAARHPDRIKSLTLIAPAGTRVRNPFRGSVYLSLVHVAIKLATLPMVGKFVVRLALSILRLQMSARLSLANKRNVSYGSLCEASLQLKTVESANDVTATALHRGNAVRFMGMIDLTGKALCFQDAHSPRLSQVLSDTLQNMDLFGNWDDIFETVAHNAHPTQLIWGSDDEFIPLKQGHKIARIMPHATLHVIDAADHFVFLNQPKKFLELLVPFFMASRALPSAPPKLSDADPA